MGLRSRSSRRQAEGEASRAEQRARILIAAIPRDGSEPRMAKQLADEAKSLQAWAAQRRAEG